MSWSTSSRTPIRCRPRSSGACAASRPQMTDGRMDRLPNPAGRAVSGRRPQAGDLSLPRRRCRRLCRGRATPSCAQDSDSVLSISTNFRSCAPILPYRERALRGHALAGDGQPGFTALDPFHRRSRRGLASRPSTLPSPTRTARPPPSSSATPKPKPSPKCAPA